MFRKKAAPGRTVVTVGRRAATEELGLDSVGLTSGQPLCTDGYMRTSLPWLYAAGDARKGVQLAHYASASAINAVEHMCGTGEYIDLSVCYRIVLSLKLLLIHSRVHERHNQSNTKNQDEIEKT